MGILCVCVLCIHNYRDIVLTYGLWDQLRVDKGREWYLSLFINEKLSSHRYCTRKPPHLQTTSKKNHTIERLWVEVNKRINYPIKKVLAEMLQSGDMSMDDTLHQYCCSWLAMHVSNIGALLFVESWNAHPIPGGRKRAMKRGIPNVLMRSDSRSKQIDPQLLPSMRAAIEQYSDQGGTISEPCSFGRDPLESSDVKKGIRYQTFCSRYSFKSLFCDVSSGCGSSYKEALLYFIDITYRLAHST